MWSELDAFPGGFASVIHISSPRPSVILLIATGPLVGQSWCFNQGYTGLQPGSSSPHCRLCWLSITPILRVFSVPLVQFGQLLLPGSVSQLSSFPCVFRALELLVPHCAGRTNSFCILLQSSRYPRTRTSSFGYKFSEET